jgi:glycerophosphoryl diester phosphodiesterase
MKKQTFEQIRSEEKDRILIAAHRGSSGGNIPCNTLAAIEIALRQGADIMEIDIQRSKDGKLWVFHEGKEPAHLCAVKNFIKDQDETGIRYMRYVNQDNDVTQFGVESLDEVLDYLKGKCYVNLDHCWDFFPDAVKCVRRHGMEEQIILKSAPKQKFFDAIKECAPDIAYMPIINKVDEFSDYLDTLGINFAGNEVLFTNLTDEVATTEYIEKMHARGKKLWVNAIIYRYTVQLAAGLSDDFSLVNDPADGWGKLSDMGYDIIQTDWTGMLRDYLEESGKIRKRK